MKKVFSFFLMWVLIMGMVTGCGGSADESSAQVESGSNEETNESTSDAQEVAEDEEVVLQVLAGQSSTDAGIEDMIDEALAKKYPNIKLEWEVVGWGTDFESKIKLYSQSGMPDILIGKAQDVATYYPYGILAPIDQTYISEVYDAASENVSYDGETYGLVYNALYQGVYYNKTMFEENGWEIPKTHEDLQKIIDDCNKKGIVPFASHMLDAWSIGNVTMQFATNDIFNDEPDWGDKFRNGEVSFEESEDFQEVYRYNELIFNNTFEDTFSTEQTECDARMVMGEAAMKVSGSWSIQNFLDIDESFDFGVFPFPNQTGDAKLIFEPNITFMTSSETKNQDAVNKVMEVIANDKELGQVINDFTKTAPMIQGVTTTYNNPSQADIDMYANNNQITDVTVGNNQLVWSSFQYENAKDIANWLLGDITFEQLLKASDSRVDVSK